MQANLAVIKLGIVDVAESHLQEFLLLAERKGYREILALADQRKCPVYKPFKRTVRKISSYAGNL